MSFSENVKNRRMKKGWTQAMFAKISGVPQSTISAIETGVRRPTFETIKMIASGLECTVDELMDNDTQEKKPVAENGDGLREAVVNLLMALPEDDLREMRDFAAFLKARCKK